MNYSFNTSAVCYSGFYDNKCRTNNTGSSSDLTFYMKKCMSIADICTLSGMTPNNNVTCKSPDGKTVPWYKNVTRVLASEEYFKYDSFNVEVLFLNGGSLFLQPIDFQKVLSSMVRGRCICLHFACK